MKKRVSAVLAMQRGQKVVLFLGLILASGSITANGVRAVQARPKAMRSVAVGGAPRAIGQMQSKNATPVLQQPVVGPEEMLSRVGETLISQALLFKTFAPEVEEARRAVLAARVAECSLSQSRADSVRSGVLAHRDFFAKLLNTDARLAQQMNACASQVRQRLPQLAEAAPDGFVPSVIGEILFHVFDTLTAFGRDADDRTCGEALGLKQSIENITNPALKSAYEAVQTTPAREFFSFLRAAIAQKEVMRLQCVWMALFAQAQARLFRACDAVVAARQSAAVGMPVLGDRAVAVIAGGGAEEAYVAAHPEAISPDVREEIEADGVITESEKDAAETDLAGEATLSPLTKCVIGAAAAVFVVGVGGFMTGALERAGRFGIKPKPEKILGLFKAMTTFVGGAKTS